MQTPPPETPSSPEESFMSVLEWNLLVVFAFSLPLVIIIIRFDDLVAVVAYRCDKLIELIEKIGKKMDVFFCFHVVLLVLKQFRVGNSDMICSDGL